MALKLPRLPDNQRLVDDSGAPTLTFSTWWQAMARRIELAVNGLADALAAAALAQTAAATATTAAAAASTAAATASTAAATANTAAATAQSSTNATSRETSLNVSYVSGLTLTATDVGASVTIAISAHTRIYGDGTTVAVNGGSLTGLPYSTDQRIYYDQVSRAGGAVSYQATASSTVAAQTGDRHSVGVVTTPAAAAGPRQGSPVRPPGYAFQ